MKNNSVIAYSLDIVGAICTAIQTEATFRIISLFLTIIATLLSIFISLYTWWKNAKKDGKIDEKELEELKKIIEEQNEKLKEKKDE